MPTTLVPPVPLRPCVPFAQDLATHGERTAIAIADETLTYEALAARVALRDG